MPFVYIIFYGGHVNCTGLRYKRSIEEAIQIFKESFNVTDVSYKIQAIAATSDTFKTFTPDSIETLKRIIPKEDHLFTVCEFFTGILIRFGSGGSAQIFYSGKVNFLGAKSECHLKYMYSVVIYILAHV